MGVGGLGLGVNTDFWKILFHGVKQSSLGTLGTRLSLEGSYNTSKEDFRKLVGCLLGGTDLNYVGHMKCVCRWEFRGKKEEGVLGYGGSGYKQLSYMGQR